MATQASRTASSTSGAAAPGSPRIRDLSSLKNGEPGSTFRGFGRGRGGRGNRGGRGGRPSSTSSSAAQGPEGRPRSDTAPQAEAPSNAASSMSTSASDKPTGRPERGAKSKPPSRRPSRPTPTVAIVPPPPSSETSPVTPRSSNHKRRSRQQSKASSDRNLKPPSSQVPSKPPKARNGSAQSPIALRKDIPPHLTTSHEAEIRHDVDALVERVRAVAMAENRPTTPGSHIDWAGEEDDSLPDLEDWGVTTVNTAVKRERDEDISPILGHALKQLPEPRSDTEREVQDTETYDGAEANEGFGAAVTPNPTQTDPSTTPGSDRSSDASVLDAFPESPSLPPEINTESPEHPLPPPQAEASIEKTENLPLKPVDDDVVSTSEGMSGSIHAPSSRELAAIEARSRSSSSERGLSASIHAPAGPLESRSAPSLLSDQSVPIKGRPYSRSHGRSHTESKPGHPSRSSRSRASSPLGKHVFTHSRNHSTPPTGGSNHRALHTSRPVITGEAISRLARTIGGIVPVPRTQDIPVMNDSPVAS